VEIKKVLIRKDGIKIVIIPKNSGIEAGDYVKIIKLEEENGSRKGEERKVFAC
jgi:hypothetical protein